MKKQRFTLFVEGEGDVLTGLHNTLVLFGLLVLGVAVVVSVVQAVW